MKSKPISVLFILAIVACVMAGCGVAGAIKDRESESVSMVEEKIVELNQRQKEILKEEGLPENVNDLETHQLRAIVAIEEMLSEIEIKYDMDFYYLSYIPKGVLDKEQLDCYTEDMGPSEVINVTREQVDGHWEYDDNYIEKRSEDEYEAALNEYLGSEFSSESVLTVIDINGSFDAEEDKDVISRSKAAVQIYLADGSFSQKNRESLAESLSDWMRTEHDCRQTEIRIYIVKGSSFDRMDHDNCEYVLDEDGYEYRSIISFDADGKSDILYSERE